MLLLFSSNSLRLKAVVDAGFPALWLMFSHGMLLSKDSNGSLSIYKSNSTTALSLKLRDFVQRVFGDKTLQSSKELSLVGKIDTARFTIGS